VNAPRLRAQSVAETLGKPSGPKFEVASIKPALALGPAIEAGNFVGIKIDSAQAHFGAFALKQMLMRAYGLQQYQLIGPDWIDTQRFEIVAKIPEGANKDEVPQMLQWLLAERFGLVAHGETRDLPAFALLVGKDGPKMKPAAPAEPAADPAPTDATPGRVSTSRGSDGSINGVSAGPFGKTVIKASNAGLHMEFERIPMADFARMLFQYLGRPVVDMTGLKGAYQVTVDFSPADIAAATKVTAAHDANQSADGDRAGVAAEPSGASVFATIQKLGLRLESRKAPIAVLVVDHIDRTPKEN
jgi:uncharacterized protein (TIGR03435 family)